MHTAASTAVSFVILFGVVGYSFVYVSGNPAQLPPQVGINVVPVSQDIADALGMKEARGLLVVDVVPGSPADKAGLEPVQVVVRNGQQVPVKWDVITAIDGTAVNTEQDVQAALEDKHAGDSLRITVLRNNNTVNLNLVLE